MTESRRSEGGRGRESRFDSDHYLTHMPQYSARLVLALDVSGYCFDNEDARKTT